MTTANNSVIPEGFPMMDYLVWRAGLTGLDSHQMVTSKIRGKEETHSILEWTFLLDDEIDYLVDLESLHSPASRSIM